MPRPALPAPAPNQRARGIAHDGRRARGRPGEAGSGGDELGARVPQPEADRAVVRAGGEEAVRDNVALGATKAGNDAPVAEDYLGDPT